MIENLSDDVERGGEVRAADAEKDADRFAGTGPQRMRFRQGADGAVEDEIFRPFGNQLVVVHFLVAVRTKRSSRSSFAGTEIWCCELVTRMAELLLPAVSPLSSNPSNGVGTWVVRSRTCWRARTRRSALARRACRSRFSIFRGWTCQTLYFIRRPFSG